MSRNHSRIPRRLRERLRLECYRRDGYRCTKCGGRGRLHAHHVVPLEYGGSHALENLVTLCRGCHINVHRRPIPAAVTRWREVLADLVESKTP